MHQAIDVHNLHVSYYGKEVLTNVSFNFEAGKLIGVLGPNGAGKSTLMKAILGLIPHDRGSIKIGNASLKDVQKSIAYVPQRSDIDWDFPIIVKDTVLLGTYPRLGLFKRPKKDEKKIAMESLDMVGMSEYAQEQIGELSGGQQQRVFLARALAQNADYFFLDEPFVGIDASSEEVIINILRNLREAGKTIFVVHHDLSKVEDYFDDIVLINKELYGSGPVKSVFQAENMKKAYGVNFMMADSPGGVM